MAVFDAVVNNADRKGGHVLPMAGGHRYGVDHGVSFHTDPKLRTVLWGWAGSALDDEEMAGLEVVRDRARRRARRGARPAPDAVRAGGHASAGGPAAADAPDADAAG